MTFYLCDFQCMYNTPLCVQVCLNSREVLCVSPGGILVWLLYMCVQYTLVCPSLSELTRGALWVSRRYTCVTFIYLCTIHPCVSKSVLTHRRCFVGLQEVYLCDFYIFVYNTPLVETITPLVLSITYYHPSELLRPPFQAKFQNFLVRSSNDPKN